MSRAIEIRNHIKSVLETTFPDLVEKVSFQKQDTVDKFPHASIYLEQMESVKAAMRGKRERTQPVSVVIYRKAADLEEVLHGNADTLESAIEATRLDNVSLQLISAETKFPADSKATWGCIHCVFTGQYLHDLG